MPPGRAVVIGSLYYDDMADVLRAAGLSVVEYEGWERRARSSGGFASPPLGCQWHHTASQTSPANDVAWMAENSDDAPIGNALIARDGVVWLIAAGAANTAGKGGPVTMSRGIVPVDSGNSTTWAWEVANNGVGEPWPQVQVDAYFAASNAANKRFGNLVTDVFTHAIGTGNGWTDRKVDPATASAVQGPWKPRSVSGSGTWSLDDIRAECSRRAGSMPPPTQPPTGGNRVATKFTILDPPLRILDTRDTNAQRLRNEGLTVTVPMAEGAVGAEVTITLAGANEPGHATVWATGAQPDVSALNAIKGESIANTLTVPVSGGKFKLQVTGADCFVIVDLVGIWAA